MKKCALLFMPVVFCALFCMALTAALFSAPARAADQDAPLPLGVVYRYADHGNVAFFIGENEQIGLCDREGNILCAPQFADVCPFIDGLARVRTSQGGYGFINERGESTVPPTYLYVNDFSDGMARVYADVDGVTLRGAIDQTGKLVIPIAFPHLFPFSDGCAIFGLKKGGNTFYGVLDKAGNVLIEPEWSGIIEVQDGYARVRRDFAWGIVSTDGTVVVEPTLEAVARPCNGYIVGKKDGRYGVCNTAGELVIPFEWRSIGAEFSSGRFVAQNAQGKYCFIDETGAVDPSLWEWDFSYGFENGYAIVQKDGRFGVMDETGKLVVRLEWDDIPSYTAGPPWTVEKDGKFGVIDENGKLIVPVVYEDADHQFSDGLAVVRQGNLYGYVDQTGRVVIPAVWQEAFAFRNGLAVVYESGDFEGYYGVIDTTGAVVVSPKWMDRPVACYDTLDDQRKADGPISYYTVDTWTEKRNERTWFNDRFQPICGYLQPEITESYECSEDDFCGDR